MQTSDLIRNLFKSFHNQNIIYCHWKSNEHLEASFKGDTDFDMLFDSSQKAEVKRIFSENGFVLFNPPYNRRYNDIEDFIAIDYEQNKIIHFHTHYSLEIGTSGLKEYRYAIEDSVLATRVFSTDFECYLIDPSYELLLLIIRLSLKVSLDWKSNFQNNKEIVLANIELDWLKERVSFESLMKLIEDLGIPYHREEVLNIYNKGFEYKSLYSVSLQKNNIKDLERENFLKINFDKWSKWLYFQYGRVLRKTGISYIIKQRINQEGGFSIAVLGSDGSGKSTLLETVRYALDIPIGNNSHEPKYKERLVQNFLGSGGKMEVEMIDKNGKTYISERIYGESPTLFELTKSGERELQYSLKNVK